MDSKIQFVTYKPQTPATYWIVGEENLFTATLYFHGPIQYQSVFWKYRPPITGPYLTVNFSLRYESVRRWLRCRKKPDVFLE